ncbi:MAG: hypothetical protein M3238_08635, partial [Actinomycetota bacterium]|nr:hypothetical protein [Actinomycetota bacterium]
PLTVDRLALTTGRPPGEVTLTVARLEVRGFATQRGAGYEISSAGARARAAVSLDEGLEP